VNQSGIEVVGQERAALAPFFPVGTEHEMVDDQLAAAGEEIRERLLAVRTVEDVIPLDSFPRQFAAFWSGLGAWIFWPVESVANAESPRSTPIGFP
jgi:hypothetical protein